MTILGLQPGDRLCNRWVLLRIIGQGGMGQVWLAKDENLESEVALKVLPPALASDARASDRMKAEAKANLELTHENIVRLYSFERDPSRNGMSFLVMEYVEGETGDDLLAESPEGLPLDRVIKIIRDVALAVDYAHSRGKLHKDIKPANIMRCRRSRKMKLLDFGIASEARASMTMVTGIADGDGAGTRPYMSPQQLLGRDGKGNDIYSLAATAYELLGGSPPFRSGDISLQIRKVPPQPLANVPAHVNQALLAGLAKRTKDRPKNAAEFSRLLAGKRPEADREASTRQSGSGGGSDQRAQTPAEYLRASPPPLPKPETSQEVSGSWYRDPDGRKFGPADDSQWSKAILAGRFRAGGSVSFDGSKWSLLGESDYWVYNSESKAYGPFTQSNFINLVIDDAAGSFTKYRQTKHVQEDGAAGWFQLDEYPHFHRSSDGELYGPWGAEDFRQAVVNGQLQSGGQIGAAGGNGWVTIEDEDYWYLPDDGEGARAILVGAAQFPESVRSGRITTGWYRRPVDLQDDGSAAWYEVASLIQSHEPEPVTGGLGGGYTEGVKELVVNLANVLCVLLFAFMGLALLGSDSPRFWASLWGSLIGATGLTAAYVGPRLSRTDLEDAGIALGGSGILIAVASPLIHLFLGDSNVKWFLDSGLGVLAVLIIVAACHLWGRAYRSAGARDTRFKGLEKPARVVVVGMIAFLIVGGCGSLAWNAWFGP